MSFTEQRNAHADDIYGSPNIYDSPTKELEPRLSGSIEAVDHCTTSMGRRPCEATFVDSNGCNVGSNSIYRVPGISRDMLEWSTIKNVTSIPKEGTSIDERSLCADEVEKSVEAIVIGTPDVHYRLDNSINICICAHTHTISSNSIRVSIAGSPVQTPVITSIGSMGASNSYPTSTDPRSQSKGMDFMQASGRCIPFLLLLTMFVFLATFLNTPYLKFMTIRRIQTSQIVGALDRHIFLGSTSSMVVFNSQEEPHHGVYPNMSSIKRAVAGASIMRPTRAYYINACLLHVRRLLHSAASIVNWIQCLILKRFKRGENVR